MVLSKEIWLHLEVVKKEIKSIGDMSTGKVHGFKNVVKNLKWYQARIGHESYILMYKSIGI